MLLMSIQKQVLEKLTLSEYYNLTSDETINFMKVIVPLGLQTSDQNQLRNVALTLTKALTYDFCIDEVFRED